MLDKHLVKTLKDQFQKLSDMNVGLNKDLFDILKQTVINFDNQIDNGEIVIEEIK